MATNTQNPSTDAEKNQQTSKQRPPLPNQEPQKPLSDRAREAQAQAERARNPLPSATQDRERGVALPEPVDLEWTTALILLTAHASTTVTVPDYELEVLKEIHGAESVVVLSESVRPTRINAATAYIKLQAKYRQNKEEVKQVFRNARVLARQFGLPYREGDDARAEYQSATVVDHANEVDPNVSGQSQNDPSKAPKQDRDSTGSGEREEEDD